jgi:hypothetical protein
MVIEDLEGLTHVSTLYSMTVLACKACDEVAAAILSDLTLLKQLADKVGGFSLLSLISFEVVVSP